LPKYGVDNFGVEKAMMTLSSWIPSVEGEFRTADMMIYRA